MAGILKVLGITTNIIVIIISQASNRKQIHKSRESTETIMKDRLRLLTGSQPEMTKRARNNGEMYLWSQRDKRRKCVPGMTVGESLS